MKMRLILVLIGLFPALLSAQQAKPTPPPLPSGPLLKRAPDFCKWTITFNPSSAQNTSTASPETQGQPSQGQPPQSVSREIKQLTVTKTKTVYHEEALDGAGGKQQSWRIGGVQIITSPNSKEPRIFDAGSSGSQGVDSSIFHDYSRTDFPGLEWVSAKNFVEIKPYMNLDCMVFRVAPAPQAAPQPDAPEGETAQVGEMIAYIGLESRLPLFAQLGEETRTYSYVSIPSVMLELPAELKTVMDQRKKQLEELTQKPPKPF